MRLAILALRIVLVADRTGGRGRPRGAPAVRAGQHQPGGDPARRDGPHRHARPDGHRADGRRPAWRWSTRRPWRPRSASVSSLRGCNGCERRARPQARRRLRRGRLGAEGEQPDPQPEPAGPRRRRRRHRCGGQRRHPRQHRRILAARACSTCSSIGSCRRPERYPLSPVSDLHRTIGGGCDGLVAGRMMAGGF